MRKGVRRNGGRSGWNTERGWGSNVNTAHGTPAARARFERGDEARGLWEWLENRRRLGELPQGLIAIDRQDVVELLKIKA